MNSLSRSKKSLNNIFAAMVNKLVLTFFPLIIRTIMIYQLGERYVGLGSLFTAILGVLSITELGFSTAVIYNMYKPMSADNYEEVNRLLNFYKKIYLIVGLIILVCGLFLCPFIPYLISDGYPNDINIYTLYIIYLLNTVFSYFFNGYKRSVLIAGQRNDIDSNINTAINIAGDILKIILLLLWPNYYIYAVTLPLITIVTNLVMSHTVDHLYPEIKAYGSLDSNEKMAIKKKVKALFFNRIGTIVMTSSDNIIISIFLGLSILTYYGNYYTVVNVIISMTYLAGGAITSIIANSIVVESIDKNRELFFTLSFWICMASGVFFTGFCILLQPLMCLWMGTDRLLNYSTVFLICIYFYTLQTRRATIIFRDASGMWEKDQYRPLVSAMINLSLNIIMVQCIGINGIVLSTIIATILIDIPWENKILFSSYLGIDNKKYYIEQLKYIAGIGFVTVISGVISCIMPVNKIIGIILMAIIILIIYVFFILIFWRNATYVKKACLYIKYALKK